MAKRSDGACKCRRPALWCNNCDKSVRRKPTPISVRSRARIRRAAEQAMEAANALGWTEGMAILAGTSDKRISDIRELDRALKAILREVSK